MKRTFWLLVIISAFTILMGVSVFGAQAELLEAEAGSAGFSSVAPLFDGDRRSYCTAEGPAALTIKAEENIEHLYIEFDLPPTAWKLTDPVSSSSITAEDGFLHKYINIPEALGEGTSSLTLTFSEGTSIADIYIYSEGELPDRIQSWSVPCKEADIMLVSSHSDDEQLFFAGILPYYAVERRLQVQVVYIVQHFSVGDDRDHIRPHEQLDGLWTVGVRNYPVMTDFPDVYSESTDRATAFSRAEAAFAAHGVTYEDFRSYLTECIRRFKPLVVVSHDLDGEYGHGTHVLCASALTEAICLAADPVQYPESYGKYGAWQVEKTYLHLYDENRIVMDWDTPYDSLGGKTPFQVTQEGFGCHKSQHWCWFYNWLYGKNAEITKASQITHYSPCEYGLYDSRVGKDVIGGDFMENIIPYAERNAVDSGEDTTEVESTADTDITSDIVTQEYLEDTDPHRPGEKKLLWIILALAGAAVVAAAAVSAAFLNRKHNEKRRRKR